MPDIQIIPAGTEQAALIADMSRQTFYETFASDNTQEDMDRFMNEQFTREKLMGEVGQPSAYFFVAYCDHEPAGYLKMKAGENPEVFGTESSIEIARLYARSTFIGKGIGSALMQAALAFARQHEKQWIWLGVWEKNFRAIRFYEKCGFMKMAEKDFLLGNDLQRDWMMGRRL